MAEVKQDPTVKAWADGKSLIEEKSSFKDFDSRGDYYRPAQGDKFTLKKAGIRTSNGNSFPVWEAYKGQKFLGYFSFRKCFGMKYVGIATSNAGKNYAKFEVTNSFCKDDTIVFGSNSLQRELNGKTLVCKAVNPQRIPAFNADLSAEDFEMVDDTYYSLEIGK